MKNQTKKALILVDLENEWSDKKSDYYVGDLFDLINRANRLIDYCRNQNYKVIFIRHIEKDSDKAFIEGSKNTQLISDLHKQNIDTVVNKYTISSFYNTDLEKELEGIEKIVVSGILTNLCVRSLVSDAYDREFQVTIVEDCCIAFDKETHDFTLQDLKNTRQEIEIIKLTDFIK